MKQYILLFVFLPWLLIAQEQNKKAKVFGFAISKDDKNILLALNNKDSGSIYLLSSNGSSPKKLITGTKKMSFFKPDYSPNEKRIVCIGYSDHKINNAAVFIANSDGTELKQVTQGNEIIRQAIFSKYDSTTILFVKADTYANYSPFAPKQAHGMDVYSLNLVTGQITNVTKMKAYGIYHISEIDSANLLLTIQAEGIFLFNRFSGHRKKIVPVNRIHKEEVYSSAAVFGMDLSSEYSDPKYSEDFKVLAFAYPYELYIMDLETKRGKLVYRAEPVLRQINDPVFFHHERKILFQKASEGGLYSVNFDGTDLRKIDINISE